MTPFALGSACTAVVAGRLVERYGRALTVIGLAGVAVGVALLAGFFVWERRVVATSGQPVFDPRLVTRTRGYAAGAGLGTVYFLGFSGIWLVLALFFQTGLDYTPLQSGLSVTPFALGSACAAVADPSANGVTASPDCSGV